MKVTVCNKLNWRFDDGLPTINEGGMYERVDPFPCARHDQKYVESLLPIVEGAFTLNPKQVPDWYLLEYESVSRTNGWSNKIWTDYGNGEWKGQITLSGKRTMIHPAMTRYLVGHEYGHIVHYWLLKQWGVKDTDEDGQSPVYKDYCNARDIELNSNYGGGNWSTNIGEIFANDFRILLTGLEKEFWPHSHVERPEKIRGLLGWWLEQKQLYSYKGDE